MGLTSAWPGRHEEVLVVSNITFISTGDPDLDALLAGVFQARHPREDDFPRGCRVLVTMPLPALAARLSAEEHIPMSQAMGLARYLRELSLIHI